LEVRLCRPDWSMILASARAQVNAPPSSVTSPGFGGRAVNGPPASVTSLGPHGYAPNAVVGAPSDGEHHHHHHDDGALLYAFPVPVAPANNAADDTQAANQTDSDDQGGPTVFDRRGSGADSYVPPVENVPKPHPAALTNNSATDEPPQPSTLLVFKDGHTIEVGNYAIVGATLFDMTPGHSRRVALADLDLNATQKQNEDRGVVFELPTAQAN
jgi:hypothetical protein